MEKLGRHFGKKAREERADLSSSWNDLWLPVSIRSAADPLEAIEQFRIEKKIDNTLAALWEEGHDPLPITYEGDASLGQESWSVDVSQAEINKRCGLTVTWTIKSTKRLKAEGIAERDLPERVLMLDEPFSEEAISRVVKRQVQTPQHPFGVILTAQPQANQ
ncbi:MAG: hypothetical protein K9J81_01785 [Desulfohalobiaceae bacterium]|nr:hypothetical protein [Desulfohalobiaceae bacterium]